MSINEMMPFSTISLRDHTGRFDISKFWTLPQCVVISKIEKKLKKLMHCDYIYLYTVTKLIFADYSRITFLLKGEDKILLFVL